MIEVKSDSTTCFKLRFSGLGGLRLLRFDPAGITASISSGSTSKSDISLHFLTDLFEDDLLGIPLKSDCVGVLAAVKLSGDFDSCN